jgi:F-type H+-transporting ATPase subunit b
MLFDLIAAGGHDPTHFDANSMKIALWALGIFIAVVFVLKTKAVGPIVAGLNARETRINESLEKAAAIEKATAELAETNRQALDEAQRQAQQIVAESRESGQRAADEIVAKAEAELEAQRDRFQREMRLESEKARAALRQDAVDLTLAASAQLMGKVLDGSDMRRLVEEALSDAESVARN